MAPANEFRRKKILDALIADIRSRKSALPSPCRIMEVCGTHTMTIHRYGLQTMLAEAGIDMVSGPGCPVCITPGEIHEAAIRIVTERENIILATFGDMTRVPTRRGSLQTAVPARGSEIKIVYSPDESLELARRRKDRDVVFFGVGFETTIPSIAVAAKTAEQERLANYSILSALWVIPPPLRAILESGEVRISGFLYPGHVSAIIGEKPYAFVAREFGYPGVIAGFEPGDILLGIRSILEQIRDKKPAVANEYRRVVRPDGNPLAVKIMKEILETKDACWRGLGMIPRSGLKLRPRWASFDAELKHGMSIKAGAGDLPGCRCGEVLRGLISPPQCPIFGKKCTPESPHGPCMVSFEGACLVHLKYRGSGR